MGATQKRKPTVKASGLTEEVAKKATKVTIPDVGEAIKKAGKALDQVDNVKKTVRRRAYTTKLVKVCDGCGCQGCSWPDQPGSGYHWVEKEVKVRGKDIVEEG